MKQHDRQFALPFRREAIAVEQCFQLRATISDLRILVTQCAGGAYCRAGAATHAKVWIDLDQVTE